MKERIKGAFTKRRILHFLKTALFVVALSLILLSKKNNNDSSIRVMTFIVCIDVLWEAIQQLHRVLLNTENIPFVNEKSVFQHKKFETTDNKYFKTIRACFATHPVNLKDDFSGEKKVEQRYASWSGGGFGKGDFSVILYSNQPDKNPEFLDIYFSELLRFAEQRYAYLTSTSGATSMSTSTKAWKSEKSFIRSILPV